MLISAPPLAPFPSCLSLVSVYLLFFWGSPGGPLKVFVRLAQNCHSGNWKWVHFQLESPSLPSHSVSFSSLPTLTCSLILYRIFVWCTYRCQPLFSLRVHHFWLSVTLPAVSLLFVFVESCLSHGPFTLCDMQHSPYLPLSFQRVPLTRFSSTVREYIPEPMPAICCQQLANIWKLSLLEENKTAQSEPIMNHC